MLVKEKDLTEDANKLADLTFHLLANCLEKEYRLAESHGLTHAEFRCLRLFGNDEGINNKTIAERMHLSPSRLTRIIDGLVLKGYMKRQIEPNDRRNMRVTLSHKGQQIVSEINNTYTNLHKEILGDINTDQHKPLITAMGHLLIALEKWNAKVDEE